MLLTISDVTKVREIEADSLYNPVCLNKVCFFFGTEVIPLPYNFFLCAGSRLIVLPISDLFIHGARMCGAAATVVLVTTASALTLFAVFSALAVV